MMQRAVEHAKDFLEHRLPASKKLLLGRCYRLEDWMADSIRSLILMPLQEWTEADFRQIPADILHRVFSARHLVYKQLVMLLFKPLPAAHDPSCSPEATRTKCSKAFEDFFRGSVANMIHPTSPMNSDQVMDLLRTSDWPGLNSECQRVTYHNLSAKGENGSCHLHLQVAARQVRLLVDFINCGGV
jgi:hypothetical protein